MATLAVAAFEAGDFSELDEVVADGGRITPSAAAALNSTDYGLEIEVEGDTVEVYGEIEFYNPYNDLIVTIYIHPHTLAMASGNEFTHLRIRYASGDDDVLALFLNYDGSNYRIRFAVYEDDATANYCSDENVTAAEHKIELILERASSDVAGDGQCQLWIDSVLEQTVSSLDNYDLFPTMDECRIGAVEGIDSGTSGIFYVDELTLEGTATVFPTTEVLDNFNRGDGDLGANWQEMMRSGNDFLIDSNECKPDGWNAEIWNVSQPGPDCEVYVSLTTFFVTGATTIVFLRMKDVTADLYQYDGYGFRAYRWDNGGVDTLVLSVARYDNSVATVLGATVNLLSFGDGDRLGGQIEGSTLSLFYDHGGTFEWKADRDDGTYSAAGYLGLFLNDADQRADDFGGGPVEAAQPVLAGGEAIHSQVFGRVTVR